MMAYLLSFLLLLSLCTPAAAQPAGAPTFTVGDEWTFTNDLVRRVVRVDGETTVMNGIYDRCKTCLYYFDKNLVILKIEEADGKPTNIGSLGFQPLGPNWKLWDFPLEVGKSWNFSAPGLFQNMTQGYAVKNVIESYEDVGTKAGTFKAFKIRRDFSIHNSINGRNFTWSTTTWYAPAAKAVVKFTSTNPNQAEWELSAYTLK